MAGWTSDELDAIGATDELRLSSTRADGTLRKPVTIWVVRVGDDLYVRSATGRGSGWFQGVQDSHEGRVSAGGVEKDVVFAEVEGPRDEIDEAYRTKYRSYPAAYVDPMITPDVQAATLQLVPWTQTDRPPVRDPIRIVPLHTSDELGTPAHGAAAPATAELVYNGGPLLPAVEVFTVFWGESWQAGAGAALATQLNDFFDFVLTSELIDQLAEYNITEATIGHGTRTGTTMVTEPALGTSVTDAAIQQTLQQWIDDGTVPAADANTLYFLYLPPNVAVALGGSRSCQAFCGYHSDVGGNVFYAVMPYPGCTGCAGGLALLDALTSTSSHELCEAITDPVAGQGWYDQHNGEIGDICAWQTKQLGSYTVQLEWSNEQGRCV